jgi:hypothetical protein
VIVLVHLEVFGGWSVNATDCTRYLLASNSEPHLVIKIRGSVDHFIVLAGGVHNKHVRRF